MYTLKKYRSYFLLSLLGFCASCSGAALPSSRPSSLSACVGSGTPLATRPSSPFPTRMQELLGQPVDPELGEQLAHYFNCWAPCISYSLLECTPPQRWITASLRQLLLSRVLEGGQEPGIAKIWLSRLGTDLDAIQEAWTPEAYAHLLYALNGYQEQGDTSPYTLSLLLGYFRQEEACSTGLFHQASTSQACVQACMEVALHAHCQREGILAREGKRAFLLKRLQAWGCLPIEALQAFLSGVRKKRQYKIAKEHLLPFLIRHNIPVQIFLQALEQAQESTKNKAKQPSLWRINYRLFFLLLRKELSSKLSEAMRPGLDQVLWGILRAQGQPEPIYAFWNTHYPGCLAPGTGESYTTNIAYSLYQIADHELPEEQYADLVLPCLNHLPSYLWDRVLREQLRGYTFGESPMLSWQEAIQAISSSLPSAAERNDLACALGTGYWQVDENLQAVCSLPQPSPRPIGRYERGDIEAWRAALEQLEPAERKAYLREQQAEVIAVVERAVHLDKGYQPRAIQRLCLLCLLNAPGKKRFLEIRPGEGKSILIVMFAVFKALEGHPVDVITPSIELSCREVQEQSALFALFGLSVAENSPCDQAEASQAKKQIAYAADVLYTIPHDYIADDLRRAFFGVQLIERLPRVGIFDEVDALFVDARAGMTRISVELPGREVLWVPLAAVWKNIIDLAEEVDHPQEGQELLPLDQRKEIIKETVLGNLGSLFPQPFTPDLARGDEAQEEVEEGCLALPNHMRAYVHAILPTWVENALVAHYAFRRDCHYDIINQKIVPIAYSSTGVLQKQVHWSQGLSQFLEMKEGLPLSLPNLVTNFKSNLTFFCAYEELYGLTGTLGGPLDQAFLAETYQADLLMVPPHRRINIQGQQGVYTAKVYPAWVACSVEAWADALLKDVLRMALEGRPVLIINEYISDAKLIAGMLRQFPQCIKNVATYTGQEDVVTTHLGPGEVLVATNIGGRGTDITFPGKVEEQGGLHVILCFMPPNERVERQAIGRAARGGKPGSARLILCDPKGRSITSIRAERDEQAREQAQKAREEVAQVHFKARLFRRFCLALNELFPDRAQYTYYLKWEMLEQSYQKMEKQIKDCFLEQGLDPQAHADAIREVTDQEFNKRFAAFHANASQKRLNAARELSGGLHSSPHLRKGVEERWGMWLEISAPLIDEGAWQEVEASFARFLEEIREEVAEDRLLVNPHYYTLQGIDCLRLNTLQGATQAFDRAIALDPSFALYAYYNKAAFLLGQEKASQYKARAQRLLQRAVELLANYKSHLITLHALLTVEEDKERPALTQPIQDRLYLLLILESQVKDALDKLDIILAEKKDLTLEEQTVSHVIGELVKQGQELPDLRQAIKEAEGEGLIFLFLLTPLNAPPYGRILVVSATGAVETMAGVYLIAQSGGTGLSIGFSLIKEGVGDMLTAYQATQTRELDLGDWGLNKAITLTALVITQASYGNLKATLEGGRSAAQELGQGVHGLLRFGLSAGQRDAFKLACLEVGGELTKQAMKSYLMPLAAAKTHELLKQGFQAYCCETLARKVAVGLNSSPWIRKAFVLDEQAEQAYWGGRFIGEAQGILFPEEEKNWATYLGQLAGQVMGRWLGMEVLDFLKGAKTTYALNSLALTFLNKLKRALERKYREEIEQLTLQKGAAPQGPRLKVHLGQAFTLEQVAEKIAHLIGGHVTHQVNQAFIMPLVSRGIHSAVDAGLRPLTSRIREKFMESRLKRSAVRMADQLSRDQPDATEHKEEDDDVLFTRAVEDTKKGQEGNILHAGLLAQQLKRTILIYDQSGHLVEMVGASQGGEAIELTYTPAHDGAPGHWSRKDGLSFRVTGAQSCLFDAVASFTGGSLDGEQLRRVTVQQMLAHKEAITDYLPTFYHVEAYYRDQTFTGAGTLATTASLWMAGEEEWERIKREHPIIAKMMSGTRYVVGVGLCVAGAYNAPAGVMVGMTVAFIYEKAVDGLGVREMKGSVAKYLRGLDKDLTPVQADFLANKLVEGAIMAGEFVVQYGAGKALGKVQGAMKQRSNGPVEPQAAAQQGSASQSTACGKQAAPSNSGQGARAKVSKKSLKKGRGKGARRKQSNTPTQAAPERVELKPIQKNRGWEFDPKKDVDMRTSTYQQALDKAFERTGVPRDQFVVTKWGRDAQGKSFPVEWKVPKGVQGAQGAQVNVDIPAFNNPGGAGPVEPHVGYQTPGKRSNGGGVSGHIFSPEPPATRYKATYPLLTPSRRPSPPPAPPAPPTPPAPPS